MQNAVSTLRSVIWPVAVADRPLPGVLMEGPGRDVVDGGALDFESSFLVAGETAGAAAPITDVAPLGLPVQLPVTMGVDQGADLAPALVVAPSGTGVLAVAAAEGTPITDRPAAVIPSPPAPALKVPRIEGPVPASVPVPHEPAAAAVDSLKPTKAAPAEEPAAPRDLRGGLAMPPPDALPDPARPGALPARHSGQGPLRHETAAAPPAAALPGAGPGAVQDARSPEAAHSEGLVPPADGAKTKGAVIEVGPVKGGVPGDTPPVPARAGEDGPVPKAAEAPLRHAAPESGPEVTQRMIAQDAPPARAGDHARAAAPTLLSHPPRLPPAAVPAAPVVVEGGHSSPALPVPETPPAAAETAMAAAAAVERPVMGRAELRLRVLSPASGADPGRFPQPKEAGESPPAAVGDRRPVPVVSISAAPAATGPAEIPAAKATLPPPAGQATEASPTPPVVAPQDPVILPDAAEVSARVQGTAPGQEVPPHPSGRETREVAPAIAPAPTPEIPHPLGEAVRAAAAILPMPTDFAIIGGEMRLDSLVGPLPGRPEPAVPGPVPGPVAPTAPATQQIAAALSQSNGPVTELRLSPEELGSVRIEVRTEGDRVTIMVAAERPETLDLLRRSVDRLGDDLRDAGFAQLDLSFGRWPGPGDDGRGDQPGPADPDSDAGGTVPSVAGPAAALAAAARPGAGNLYLRI